MIAAVCLALVALTVTVLFHYEGLRFLSRVSRALKGHSRSRPVGLIFGIIGLHLVETLFYALAYWLGDTVLHIGEFVGDMEGPLHYVLFSAETYTTLGFGDIYPTGPLRILVSLEGLNGLLMLGWSASFLYLEMQKYWDRSMR